MGDTFKRYLQVKLTEFELLERARQMAETTKLRQKKDAEKAATMRALTEELKELDGQIAKLSTVVQTGEEQRHVECHKRYDYENRKVTTVRDDTGETIETREMYDEEKQVQLTLSQAADVVL